MATFTGTSGSDGFTGLADTADTFVFTAATLSANDTVVGGGGSSVDTLQFSAAGSFASGLFAGISGIERILLAAGTNTLTLPASLAATASAPLQVVGSSGADTLSAAAITDPLRGVSFDTGAGNNRFTGGAGNDTVVAGSGNDTVDGHSGIDTLSYAGTSGALTISLAVTATQATGAGGSDLLSNVENLIGGAGGDRLTGSTAANRLDGGSGNDTLTGGDGNDLLNGQSGTDSLVGGNGNDIYTVDVASDVIGETSSTGGTDRVDASLGWTLGANLENLRLLATGAANGTGNTLGNTIFAGAGANTIDGGDGVDTLSWRYAGAGITFSLGIAGAQSTGGSGSDSAVRIENLTGSSFNDNLTGNSAANQLDGGTGNDTLRGAGGNDTLYSSIAALGAADVLDGGSGTDKLQLAGAGNVAAASLGGLLSVEQIALGSGGATELRLSDAAVVQAGGVLTIVGNADIGRVIASDVNAGRSVVYIAGAGTGSDEFVGGAGNDVYVVQGFAFGSLDEGDDILRMAGPGASGDSVDGGSGSDTVEITAGGAYDLSGLFDFEQVVLQQAADVRMSSTPEQALEGSSGNDRITLGGAGQTVLADAGDDVVIVTGPALLGGATLNGGAQAVLDTLRLDGTGTWNLRSGVLVTGFERVELASGSAGASVVLGNQPYELLLGSAASVSMGSHAAQSVVGSNAADSITVGAAGQVVVAGAGNDVVSSTTAFLTGGAQLSGGSGSDQLRLSGGGSADLEFLVAFGFETVVLDAAMTLWTPSSGVTAVIGSGGADTITVRGAATQVDAGAGNDTLRAIGIGDTLNGGSGSDLFQIFSFDGAIWSSPTPTTLNGGTEAFVLDTLEIGSGAAAALSLDLTQHTISGIDRVVINGAPGGATVTLTVGDAMVSTADGNNGGIGGDLNIDAGSGTVLQNVVVDASGLGASSLFRFGSLTPDAFLGNDTVSSGAGPDIMAAAAGNDSLAGNAGADTLAGGTGNDTLVGGEGLDIVTGNAGGDLLQLGEPTAAVDVVRFTAQGDGSLDIDTSVAESTADRITGFNATSDVVQLSRSGLGLGSGSVVSVPANGAWNIGAGAVFLFESNSANADTLAADNFGALADLASGINLDNAAGSGSSAGRTVALVISNLEFSALRRTGIYTWTDSDGDSVLEASDVVRLLGVIDGVTANQLGADDILIVS